MNARYPDGIPQPRPRGRPRVDEPKTAVTTWLPPSVYDRLTRIAEHREMHVSQLVREIIIVRLPRE